MQQQHAQQEWKSGLKDDDILRNESQHYLADTIKGIPQGLLEEQKAVMQDYYKQLCIENKRPGSIALNLRTLYFFALYLKKPFNEATRENLRDYICYLQRKGNKESSIALFISLIKKFYKFVFGTETYPPVVSWITKVRIKPAHKSEDELLSQQDIIKLCNVADNDMDKCIIMMLYDSACRRSELKNLKIGNIIFDDYGCRIKVDGKTGQRTIRLYDSVPYIKAWLNNHPCKDNLQAPLFMLKTRLYGREVGRQYLLYLLNRVTGRAQLGKRVHPHLFRHSRLTELGRMGFTERDLRIFAGWAAGSNMPETYLHYGEEAVDEKLLISKGVVKASEASRINKLKPVICPACFAKNPVDAHFCACGERLDIHTPAEVAEKAKLSGELESIFEDPEFQKMLTNYLEKKLKR